MCKYHRIYECKKGCNPEIVKLSLAGDNNQFTVTNNGTVTLCDSIIVCSKQLGKYKKSLCNNPLFPGESVSIERPSTVEEDVAMAFVKVGDKEYVVSNEIKVYNNNYWFYSIFISKYQNTYTLIFSNDMTSSVAKNVKVKFTFNEPIDTSTINRTNGVDSVTTEGYSSTILINEMNPGNIAILVITVSPTNMLRNDKIVVTSDTPLKPGYPELTMDIQ